MTMKKIFSIPKIDQKWSKITKIAENDHETNFSIKKTIKNGQK